MIHANELRIGNWFHPTSFSNGVRLPITGRFHRVTGINSFGEIEECLPTRAETLVFSSKEIESIPLTPAILEKAGWKQNTTLPHLYFFHGLKYDVNRRCLTILRSCNMAGESQPHICGKSIGDNIQVKYIHQLQNLYFALTGEELTIQL